MITRYINITPVSSVLKEKHHDVIYNRLLVITMSYAVTYSAVRVYIHIQHVITMQSWRKGVTEAKSLHACILACISSSCSTDG